MSNTEQQTKEKDAMLKELILKFPKEHKIKLMKDALEEATLPLLSAHQDSFEPHFKRRGLFDEIPHPVNHANKRK